MGHFVRQRALVSEQQGTDACGWPPNEMHRRLRLAAKLGRYWLYQPHRAVICWSRPRIRIRLRAEALPVAGEYA